MNNWSMDGFEGCCAESVGLKKKEMMACFGSRSLPEVQLPETDPSGVSGWLEAASQQSLSLVKMADEIVMNQSLIIRVS